MSDAKNSELLDLLLGELEPAREAALRTRLRDDAALRAELAELEALFGLMRRGEEIEADPAVHDRVMEEARRLTRPTVLQWIRSIPELVRFRFQHSRGFRVAAISLGVHIVVMVALLQFMVRSNADRTPPAFELGQTETDEPEIRPDAAFVQRLTFARTSRSVRLHKHGVKGQRTAIHDGIEALLGRQTEDGAFGSFDDTCRAALILLSERVSSGDMTRRGQALYRAMRNIRTKVDAGAQSPHALSALVEDWALNFADLSELDRASVASGIRTLLVRGGNGAEGLYWAASAGFADHVQEPFEPIERDLSAASRAAFQAHLKSGAQGDTAALLSLQSPYRF